MVFGLLFCISIWKECFVTVAATLRSPDAGSGEIRYGDAEAVLHRSPGSYRSRGTRLYLQFRGGQALKPRRAARGCGRQQSANCLTGTRRQCHALLRGRLQVTDARKRLVCSLSGGEGRGTRPSPEKIALDTCYISGTKRRNLLEERNREKTWAGLAVLWRACLQPKAQP